MRLFAWIMNKTLIRFSELLCLSIIMCFFISCDDINEIPAAVVGKVKSVTVKSENSNWSYYYEYDINGKLTKVSDVLENTVYYEVFSPNGNQLIVTSYTNYSFLYSTDSASMNTFGYVDSKKIISSNIYLSKDRFSFKYNSNGFLTDIYEDWGSSSDTAKYYHDVFEINGNNVVKLYHPSGIVVKYEYYDGYINNGIYQIQSREMGGITLHPGYYGRNSYNLLKYKIYSSGNQFNDTLKYEYVFAQNKVQKEIIKSGNKVYMESEYEYY